MHLAFFVRYCRVVRCEERARLVSFRFCIARICESPLLLLSLRTERMAERGEAREKGLTWNERIFLLLLSGFAWNDAHLNGAHVFDRADLTNYIALNNAVNCENFPCPSPCHFQNEFRHFQDTHRVLHWLKAAFCSTGFESEFINHQFRKNIHLTGRIDHIPHTCAEFTRTYNFGISLFSARIFVRMDSWLRHSGPSLDVRALEVLRLHNWLSDFIVKCPTFWLSNLTRIGRGKSFNRN